MTYFHQSVDKDATKAFIYDDLKVLGIKIPKLDKIAKLSALLSSSEQLGEHKCATGGKAVFGIPLALMESVEDVNIGYIPKFLVEIRQFLSKHLDREGLFRKSGSISRQRDLAQRIENGCDYMDDAQVNDVTSIVKQFFRAMPEPLVPHILQEAFIQAVQLPSDDSKIYSLALLCLLLPSQHLSVLRYTLEILSDVSSNAKANKMNAHNLAVCLTPNIFHTKENSKHVELQTEAMRLCIENVINIGAVPPSIAEKVVMLRSLEANQMENNSLDSSSSVPSLRKKRRSGSLQGIVGSIRRSVEKMRSKASRRSASVPDDLNLLNQLEDDGARQGHPHSGDSAIDTSSATPQIMQKKNSSRDPAGFSLQKRKAILNQSSSLGTPLSKLNLWSQSSDNVFESPNQSSLLTNQTSSSINSTRLEDSRLGTSRSRKKSWTGLRSPFNKRKRSLSAGPNLSPNRSRSSSKTRNLIRMLSGGKRKTPDMVGQRLAFSSEEDVVSVRCRMPSAPTALCFNSSLNGGDNTAMSNEEFLLTLNSDLANSDTSCLYPSQQGEEGRALTRNLTLKQSRPARATLRRRAKSADNRVLRRGRPNHPATGLNQKKRPAIAKHMYSGSPSTETNADSEIVISSPLGAAELPPHVHLMDLSGTVCNSQPAHAADGATQPTAVGPCKTETSSERDPCTDGEDFDARMERIAQIHSDLFSKPPVPRQKPSGKSHRSATFSHRSTNSGRLGADQMERVRKRVSDTNVRLPKDSSQVSIGSSDSGTGSYCRGRVASGIGKEGSQSSLTSTDSGISETETSQIFPDAGERRCIENRIVIGGNEKSGIPFVPNGTSTAPHHHPLIVRGAQLQSVTHATSLSNLQEASKVKQSKQIFDATISDTCGDKHSCKESELNSPVSKEIHSNGLASRMANKVSGKPPRQAPVRIPTVFAKNDPRAMRYKNAADALRRRSQQDAKTGNQGAVLQTDIDSGLPEHVNRVTVCAGTNSTTVANKLLNSTPPYNSRASCRLPHHFEDSPSSKATPRIPISTDIVRGASASPLRKVLTSAVTSDRLPLRDHSPNIERPPVTPKIKSAMLPIDRIKSAGRQSASRKSPRTRHASHHRVAPYTTTPKRPSARVSSSCTAKDTAL